jgi:Flp pilus assembly protein TadG
MRKFLDEIARLGRDSSGNVAVIFLIALVPLLSFLGAAVDYSRASSARTAMQAALDSASLMIAKDLSSGTLKPADVSSKGLAYFTAMYVHKDAKNVTANATYTQASGTNGSTVVLNAAAEINTEFMQIVGFPKMGFNSSSTSTWGNSLLRVALVLDNTGSMCPGGNCEKLNDLKAASKNLVDKLGVLAKASGDVLISVVPFASAVNVGTDKKDATWLRWDLWDPKLENSSGDSYCSTGSWYTMAMCKGHGYSWNHTVGSPATTQWNGCVSDRDQNYDVASAAPTSLATKFVADQDSYCPTKLLPLNSAFSTSDKQTIKDTITAMTAQGGTNQTIGLQWGWLSLLQQAPLNAPAEDPNNVYQRVIILFSDGQNTVNRWNGNGTMGTSAAERKKIDDRMALLCAEAKKTATIYTVQLDDGTGVSPVLPACASGTQNFFMLTNPSEIDSAFSQITTSISKLRVAK